MWWLASENFTNIVAHHDGARAHTGRNNTALLTEAGIPTERERQLGILPIVPCTQPAQSPDNNCCDLAFFCARNKHFRKQMKLKSVGDVKKLVEHVLTTFKNFPVETLSDMWRTKTRVLKAIVACDGGNDYAIPRSNTD